MTKEFERLKTLLQLSAPKDWEPQVDFAEAAKNPMSGYHKIEFEEDPHEIYLDAKQVEEDGAQLQKTYSIPALRHL